MPTSIPWAAVCPPLFYLPPCPALPCPAERCTTPHSTHHIPLSCPALQTPLNALRFAQLCNEAGIPAGTINVSTYCALLCCVVSGCTCACAALRVAVGRELPHCRHFLANGHPCQCLALLEASAGLLSAEPAVSVLVAIL